MAMGTQKLAAMLPALGDTQKRAEGMPSFHHHRIVLIAIASPQDSGPPGVILVLVSLRLL